jgi:glycerol uptake facilitator-like aquaporin
LIGGYFGYALLRAVTPSHAFEGSENSFCVTIPAVDDFKAFWIEFFMTMALIMICYGVWDQRNANHHDSVPLRFGLAISGLALVGVRKLNYLSLTEFNNFQLGPIFRRIDESGSKFWPSII